MPWISLLVVVACLAASAARPCPTDADFAASSAQPGDRFGAALTGAGDVDGDGFPDVLVGAYRAEPHGPLSGRALLFSGRNARVLQRWEGDDAYDALGWSVAALGDLNADGVPDLGLGAPAGTPAEGSVHVVSGADGALLYQVIGKQAGDRFGHAISALGDVDEDGVSDFAVSAPHASTSSQLAGRVSLHSGVDGSVLRVHDGAGFDFFGQALARVDDLNDDGVAELLVGAPFSDVGAFNAGSAWLFSGLDGVELMAIHGESVGDQLGHWVAGAGDVDADGVTDLAVGIPGDDSGGLDAGAVQVHSGATGELLWQLIGDDAGQGWGVVAGPGDVDGDGHDDLAMGSTNAGAPDAPSSAGRVRIVSGATGSTLLERVGRSGDAWFGFALAGAGDLNADGRPELLVGAPGHDDVLSVLGSVRALSAPSARRSQRTR